MPGAFSEQNDIEFLFLMEFKVLSLFHIMYCSQLI